MLVSLEIGPSLIEARHRYVGEFNELNIRPLELLDRRARIINDPQSP